MYYSSLDEHNRAFQMSRSQTMTGLPKIGSRQGDIRGSGNYANAPVSEYEPRNEISNNVVFSTSVDSDEPVQPPLKLRYSK